METNISFSFSLTRITLIKNKMFGCDSGATVHKQLLQSSNEQINDVIVAKQKTSRASVTNKAAF